MESIYRSGSCYLHQNRFPDRSLCYIDGVVFAAVVAQLTPLEAYSGMLFATVDLSLLDNHVAH
jgi:hypothetical protein